MRTPTIGATYSITDTRSAQNAATIHAASAYAAEREAYEDSRRYRDLNAMMRCNRNTSFS